MASRTPEVKHCHLHRTEFVAERGCPQCTADMVKAVKADIGEPLIGKGKGQMFMGICKTCNNSFIHSAPNIEVCMTCAGKAEAEDLGSPSAWDVQVGGEHYKKGIQPFEYAMANGLNSLEFSVVKYLRKKGDKAKRLEDLAKAQHCLQMLVEWVKADGKI